MHMQEIIEKDRIISVISLYAYACDSRNWALFRQIFTADVHANYGGFQFQGCDEVVAVIRSNLGGCGPTQHMLFNFRIELHGDSASACCQLRSSHIGGKGREGLFFEVWGEYRDMLRKQDGEWRIARREMIISHETGTREVLAAEAGQT